MFETTKMSDDEFLQLGDIIYKKSAITLLREKKYFMENRLTRRLAELDFNTFKDYIYYIKYDPAGESELNYLVNATTVNETYFFRDRSQIDYWLNVMLPESMRQGKTEFRIWSAACSTGEEPYSLVMLLDSMGMYYKARFHIVATDINSNVVDMAKKGEYGEYSLKNVPDEMLEKYFTKNSNNVITLSQRIKDRVVFKTGNLIDPLSCERTGGNFDVIFCRNVLIYFDNKAKEQVINMFYSHLKTSGCLFLGYAESLSALKHKYHSLNFSSGTVHIKE
ncbi:protein-glutamate O-methyltransferase CheR [Deferribacterales bacterium RsTz2092]|nr:chemotaxis protein [Deferribacterales bacterium]